jgi:hypothetical protein
LIAGKNFFLKKNDRVVRDIEKSVFLRHQKGTLP